jgi:hypothetical protein
MATRDTIVSHSKHTSPSPSLLSFRSTLLFRLKLVVHSIHSVPLWFLRPLSIMTLVSRSGYSSRFIRCLSHFPSTYLALHYFSLSPSLYSSNEVDKFLDFFFVFLTVHHSILVYITNLMHICFNLQYTYYISCLDMFLTIICSSSGGSNCFLQDLVCLSTSGRVVHWLRVDKGCLFHGAESFLRS